MADGLVKAPALKANLLKFKLNIVLLEENWRYFADMAAFNISGKAQHSSSKFLDTEILENMIANAMYSPWSSL